MTTDSVPAHDEPYTPTTEDHDLWDAVDDILDMLNIEDLNPPGLVEQMADYFRDRFPLLSREGVAEHDAVVRADQAEKTLLEAANAYSAEFAYDESKRTEFMAPLSVTEWLRRRAVVLTPTTKETEQ